MNKLHSFTFEPQKGKGGGQSPLSHVIRPFAQEWAFLRYFKRRKYRFSSPIPSMQSVPMFELPIENNKHPNFEGGVRGGKRVLLFSEVTLFENNVSTILLPIVALPR